MISSDGAHTAQHGTLDPTTLKTKDNEPGLTLTQREEYAIAKRQRRQQTKGQKQHGLLCFGHTYLDWTSMLETNLQGSSGRHISPNASLGKNRRLYWCPDDSDQDTMLIQLP